MSDQRKPGSGEVSEDVREIYTRRERQHLVLLDRRLNHLKVQMREIELARDGDWRGKDWIKAEISALTWALTELEYLTPEGEPR